MARPTTNRYAAQFLVFGATSTLILLLWAAPAEAKVWWTCHCSVQLAGPECDDSQELYNIESGLNCTKIKCAIQNDKQKSKCQDRCYELALGEFNNPERVCSKVGYPFSGQLKVWSFLGAKDKDCRTAHTSRTLKCRPEQSCKICRCPPEYDLIGCDRCRGRCIPDGPVTGVSIVDGLVEFDATDCDRCSSPAEATWTD